MKAFVGKQTNKTCRNKQGKFTQKFRILITIQREENFRWGEKRGKIEIKCRCNLKEE